MTIPTLLERLIRRGDIVEITQGQLSITSASGIEVPEEWFADNTESLISTILEVTNVSAMRYVSHSVKDYKANGYLTLTLQTVRHLSTRYIIFNVKRDRQRTTKHGEQGSKLPAGHFWALPTSDLMKFWRRSNLNLPKPSVFHDYVGNLKGRLLTGVTENPAEEKITKASFGLLNVSAEEIQKALTVSNTTAKEPPPNRQHTSKPRLTPQPSATPTPCIDAAFSDISVHAKAHREKTNSNTVIQFPYSPTNPAFRSSSGKPPEDQTVEEWLADYEEGPDFKTLNLPNDFEQKEKNKGDLWATPS